MLDKSEKFKKRDPWNLCDVFSFHFSINMNMCDCYDISGTVGSFNEENSGIPMG